jgi:hypothetical protein
LRSCSRRAQRPFLRGAGVERSRSEFERPGSAGAKDFAQALCKIAAFVTPEALQKHLRKPKDKKQADQAADEKLDESERPRFAGVCFFLAGTQSSAKIAIDGFTLGKFGFIARGNDAAGELDVMADAAVDDVFVDIGRNDASLTITGEGSFECPDVDGVVCPE